MENIPCYQDVEKAALRISEIATKTPLIENQVLNDLTGAKIFIKPECLQKTGSFKFRGAYNAISMLDKEQMKLGVVACSSGNHGQGIAQSARILGTAATIIMPADSPNIKLQCTKRSGAHIITYDRASEDRDVIAKKMCDETGAIFIHPYNNPNVIAGQGTVGLEIAQSFLSGHDEIIAPPDRVLICTGGGGLTAGIALAISHHFPNAKIHSVEPENFDDYRRSLMAGERVENRATSGSICDAILVREPGELGFAINRNLLSEGFAISDDQALNAVKFAFNELKLVVEPGGAIALAALLQADKKWSGENIVCIISGGNIDPETMALALAR